MIAHIEERLEGVLAGGVVWVHVVLVLLLGLRLLDIPEDVSRHLLEDFFGCGRRDALVECCTQVLHIVVLLATLESIELASEDGVPLFRVDTLLFEGIKDRGADLCLIFTLKGLEAAHLLEGRAELIFLKLVTEVLVAQLKEESSIL